MYLQKFKKGRFLFRQLAGRTNGRTNERPNERTDERTNERTDIFKKAQLYPKTKPLVPRGNKVDCNMLNSPTCESHFLSQCLKNLLINFLPSLRTFALVPKEEFLHKQNVWISYFVVIFKVFINQHTTCCVILVGVVGVVRGIFTS